MKKIGLKSISVEIGTHLNPQRSPLTHRCQLRRLEMREPQCGKIAVLCRERRQAGDKHREGADKESKPFA